MRVIVVSAEPLFLDGLVALFDSRADVTAGTSVRESIRAALLDADSVVVVDSRSVSQKDLDYLVGAREFGLFQVFVITEPNAEVEEALGIAVSNQTRGADLVAAILGPTSQMAGEPSPRLSESENSFKVKRGRPRLSTNSLPLAPRQYELARLIGQGHSNANIAEIMGLRDQTVKNMVRTVSQRLSCATRQDIAHRMSETS